MTGRYDVDGQQRTLFDTAARMASSLADVFLGNARGVGVARLVSRCSLSLGQAAMSLSLWERVRVRAMPRKEYVLSGYRGMWLFAMFDLPVTTAKARKRYTAVPQTACRARVLDATILGVRAVLRKRGDGRSRIAGGFGRSLPPEGYVRLLAVTDRQFGKMESYIGEMSRSLEEPPSQLVLF